MLHAAAKPDLDFEPARHDRPEAHWLRVNRPSQDKPATERQSGSPQGRGTRMASNDGPGMCNHWPDGGIERIWAAAGMLRGVAMNLGQAGLMEPPTVRYTGCVDLESLPWEPSGDSPPLRLAAMLAQVQAQSLALSALADDFATVSRWLTTTAESNWVAARAMRRLPDMEAAIGESQRLISKDSHAADANALIATMLRRAVKLLDRLSLVAGRVNVDTAQLEMGVRVLIPTAELLDNAAHLAADAAGFVEDFDRRWRQMRYQAELAIESTASPAALAQARL